MLLITRQSASRPRVTRLVATPLPLAPSWRGRCGRPCCSTTSRATSTSPPRPSTRARTAASRLGRRASVVALRCPATIRLYKISEFSSVGGTRSSREPLVGAVHGSGPPPCCIGQSKPLGRQGYAEKTANFATVRTEQWLAIRTCMVPSTVLSYLRIAVAQHCLVCKVGRASGRAADLAGCGPACKLMAYVYLVDMDQIQKKQKFLGTARIASKKTFFVPRISSSYE